MTQAKPPPLLRRRSFHFSASNFNSSFPTLEWSNKPAKSAADSLLPVAEGPDIVQLGKEAEPQHNNGTVTISGPAGFYNYIQSKVMRLQQRLRTPCKCQQAAGEGRRPSLGWLRSAGP